MNVILSSYNGKNNSKSCVRSGIQTCKFLFLFFISISGNCLRASERAVDYAAASLLTGGMGWFTHLEPPRHIVEGRQFALDNAKDINNYVIALLEKYDYEILPYRPFAVTNVIRYTEKGDPAGALLLAERFRDYLQKTTDRLLVNENSSSLLNDLDERDKKRFINRLIERKNEMANYVMAHKNGNKIFIQIDDILDQSVEKTIASMEQSNNNANNLNSPQETNQEKTLLTGTTKPKTNTNIFIYVIITASMLIILSLIIRRACRKQPPTSQPLAQRAKLCKKQQERCF